MNSSAGLLTRRTPDRGRIFALIAAAGFLLLACLIAYKSVRVAMGHGDMNVLLVTLDTTRADYLGCYGYRESITPNLDRLAAESVIFDQAIAQAAVTPVSHASILTGLNPYHHGLRVLHGLVANRLAEHKDSSILTHPSSTIIKARLSQKTVRSIRAVANEGRTRQHALQFLGFMINDVRPGQSSCGFTISIRMIHVCYRQGRLLSGSHRNHTRRTMC
jgi:hypothetical protein